MSHPEWRIGRVPKPLFEDATTIQTAAEAWCTQGQAIRQARSWSVKSYSDGKTTQTLARVTEGSLEFKSTDANTSAEGLASTLLKAIRGY